VVPVYRSALVLPELYRQISESFRDYDFEVLFVEDCGGDNSWVSICDLAQKYSSVRGYRLSRNYGQHNALLCGIRNAKGDIIVTIDDDLQHPPDEVHKLIVELKKGYDVVYGPPIDEKHGFLRDIASKLTKWALQRTIGVQNARNVSALRVFKSRLREAFSDFSSPTVNIDVLLSWASTSFTYKRVRHDNRKSGVSGYTTKKLIKHSLNMMTGFSTLPLQLASIIGFGIALFGLGILVYIIVILILKGVTVPGFFFLTSIISIFSGAQLIVLGIFGEYISRMYLKSMDRPAYHISHDTISKESRLN